MMGGKNPPEGDMLPHHIVKIKLETESRLYYESFSRLVTENSNILGVCHGAHGHHIWKTWVKLIRLTRRKISGLRIVYLDLLDVTSSGGVYNHLITLLITSHEPVNSSGSSSAPSWRKPF
jgi:hypothetical protein